MLSSCRRASMFTLSDDRVHCDARPSCKRQLAVESSHDFKTARSPSYAGKIVDARGCFWRKPGAQIGERRRHEFKAGSRERDARAILRNQAKANEAVDNHWLTRLQRATAKHPDQCFLLLTTEVVPHQGGSPRIALPNLIMLRGRGGSPAADLQIQILDGVSVRTRKDCAQRNTTGV
jgi:hypothetical protein